MKVVKMDRISKEVFINPIFTGREVTRQVLLPESKEYEVNIINFGKGVRNKFHAHNCEQILIITAGKGVVATETEEKIVTVGDIVLIPAGEKHWHGSAGDSDFSHVFVIKVGNKVTQLEE
jgi:quercetin dioxygenase-like cupin family protein